jgi:large subunit ribosomal protein L23
MANYTDIILKPLITEKANLATEKTNRYGFQVILSANKNQIKQAVEALYNVKVLDIKTSINAGKEKRYGKHMTKKTQSKKAYVKLAEGQRIEFFKGV